MMPDRIGIIGNTHGVNASSKPESEEAEQREPAVARQVRGQRLFFRLSSARVAAAVASPACGRGRPQAG